MFKRKVITGLVILMFFITPSSHIHAEGSGQINSISAHGVVLMDVHSGRVLYEKNADQKMRIASLTKIMTAIVAIENGDLEEMISTSDFAYGTEGSSIYLKKGEKLSLEDMLYGLMLRSGNDAAVAIAEHIGGSVEGFTFLMNEKAAYLGMNGSHFMNPHGLDHKEHYSTPRDMAILTAYALKNPIFKKIVGTKVKSAPLEGESWDRKWLNKNKLLNMYPYADGVKTGYTKLAKRCLASSATKDGMQLAIITLNAPDDWNDHIQLFDYAFEHYHSVSLIEKDKPLGKVKVNKEKELNIVAVDDFIFPLQGGEEEYIGKKLKLDDQKMIKSGQVIGKIEFFYKDQYIGSVQVKAMDQTTFKQNVINVWKRLWRGE